MVALLVLPGLPWLISNASALKPLMHDVERKTQPRMKVFIPAA